MAIGRVYVDGIARFNLAEVAVVCARRYWRGVLRTVRQFNWLKAFPRNAAGSLRACGERIGSLKNHIKQSNKKTIQEVH